MLTNHLVVESLSKMRLLGCFLRSMDINIRELPTLIVSSFILHSFCEIRNKKMPNARLQDHYAEEKIANQEKKI